MEEVRIETRPSLEDGSRSDKFYEKSKISNPGDRRNALETLRRVRRRRENEFTYSYRQGRSTAALVPLAREIKAAAAAGKW
jgi:hypothetical protein